MVPWRTRGLQGLIEGLHTVGLTGLEGGVDLGDFVLADEVAHGRCGNQDFVRGDAAVAVAGFQQGLGNNGAQGFGQHGAHDFFFAGREYVDNTVDGFGGAGRVQRAENQVAGFGGGQAEGGLVSGSRISPIKITSGSSRGRNAGRW